MTLPPATEANLRHQKPFLWLNPSWLPMLETAAPNITLNDIRSAHDRLQRFGGLLKRLFPQLSCTRGIIESPLLNAEALRRTMKPRQRTSGRWLIKADHALPVAGSVKARGGVYEVLGHAEDLALRSKVMSIGENPLVLSSPAARELFADHQILVGSTGNLGLSIGITAAALGFRSIVHMSADAKSWKKVRLREAGVHIVEHTGDYRQAVAAGRRQAQSEPKAYFVDDEGSTQLFLGYSVAAIRLAAQLARAQIAVDAKHPLFVYLPCGVGGAPGGITFGLRHIFGDNVHCFFAEPTAAPCMLIRLAALEDRPISIEEMGLDGITEADGLAVGQASELIVSLVRPLVSGVFTVTDETLLEDLYRLHEATQQRIEPSAAAGLRGPALLLNSPAGQEYLARRKLVDSLGQATHVLWTTGGSLLPETEYQSFYERGRVTVKAYERDPFCGSDSICGS